MTVIPIRKPTPELRYRQKLRRQHIKELQAEVAARKMREMDDYFTQMLADALALELECADFRRVLETY